MAKLSKQLDGVREHLQVGEEIIASVLGAYETKLMGNDSVRNGALIATDRRLVFYAKKLTGYDLESFPYSAISSLEISKGMMGSRVAFFASGNKVSIKWIKDAEALAAVIDATNSRRSAAPAPPATDGLDAVDQIKRLAELRDSGLLTDDEFQAKKTQLLGL